MLTSNAKSSVSIDALLTKFNDKNILTFITYLEEKTDLYHYKKTSNALNELQLVITLNPLQENE